TPLLTFGPASDETVSITPTVRGILRRSVPKHWSSYGLAVIAGLAAAVGCGTDGGTGPAADYTLSLTPAALTIVRGLSGSTTVAISRTNFTGAVTLSLDRKSTRLNSSHVEISYAVFCLKKKT